MLRIRYILILFFVFSLFNGLVEAAGEYAFIVRGTVTEIISQGNASDYKLKQADGETVLLKLPGTDLEKGQDVAFFVRLGAQEGGLITYLPIKKLEIPTPFTDGIARIKVKSGACMMFDKQGRSVGKQYAEISSFHEGLSSVKVQQYGDSSFVDNEGNLVIPSIGDVNWHFDGPYFQNGFATISSRKESGYIDKNGNFVISGKDDGWDPLTPFSEGYAFVKFNFKNRQKNGGIYLIDEKGVISEKPLTNEHSVRNPCLPFSNGLAAFKKGNGWGFIDYTGVFVIEPEYSNVCSFSEGYAAVQTSDGRWGYINTKGNWVVNAVYEKAYPFSDGMAAVSIEEKGHSMWGYVNTKGELAIKAIYDKAGLFSGGVAPVSFTEEVIKYNSKWGLIDKNGKWVMEPRYSSVYGQPGDLFGITRFSDDLLLVGESVGSSHKYAWIDRNGKENLFFLVPPYTLW